MENLQKSISIIQNHRSDYEIQRYNGERFTLTRGQMRDLIIDSPKLYDFLPFRAHERDDIKQMICDVYLRCESQSFCDRLRKFIDDNPHY